MNKLLSSQIVYKVNMAALSNDDKTRRIVDDILEGARKSTMPGKIKPMLATLVNEPFDDPEWLYEVKWDGYRAVAVIDKKGAELISRNNLPFDKYYPINK